VIWGASGHALVVADIVRLQGNYTIMGFLDDINPERRGTAFEGSSILGGEEQLDKLLSQGINNILIGFGDCRMRFEKMRMLKEKGFSFPVAIHPSSVIADSVTFGPGTVIAAGTVINPKCIIGEGVIINTSASVDHECVIGDASHLSPGVHLSGQVTIGEATHVGIGTSVIQQVRIGRGTVIGAGSVVISDLPDFVVAYGVPAKINRSLVSF